MNSTYIKFPAYFAVDNDEMAVHVFIVNDKLVAVNDLGNHYDLDRLPMSPYRQITEKEFNDFAARRRSQFAQPR